MPCGMRHKASVSRLGPYSSTDPYGYVSYFLKRTANVMTLRLSVVFWLLVRQSSFPSCWRQANATPIPKAPPSSSFLNSRPISITSVLSVFEHLVSVRLGRFMERCGVLPTTQLRFGKVRVAVMQVFACREHYKVH